MLPWASLIALGSATLVMVTSEMLPAALLGPMSHGLEVSDARTAQLVSLWAAVMVLTSFPAVRLTRGRDRRTVILVGLAGLAVSSALTAATSYATVLGARFVGAVAVGLLWSTINALVADMVEDRLLGPAISVVLGGATLGMVLGTPLARLVADAVGWRAPFAMLGVAGVVVLAQVRSVVPPSRPGSTADADSGGGVRRTAWPMMAATGLVGNRTGRPLPAPTRSSPDWRRCRPTGWSAGPARSCSSSGSSRPWAWLRPGGPRPHRSCSGEHGGSGGCRAAGPGTGGLRLRRRRGGGGGGMGRAVGDLPPLAQTQILRLAGPEHRSTAGALIPVLFNGGIAVGAGLAAVAVAHAGVGVLPGLAAAVVATAALGLAALSRRPAAN